MLGLRKQYEFLCTVEQAMDMFKNGKADTVVMVADNGKNNTLVTLVRIDGMKDMAIINKEMFWLLDDIEQDILAIEDLEVQLVAK